MGLVAKNLLLLLVTAALAVGAPQDEPAQKYQALLKEQEQGALAKLPQKFQELAEQFVQITDQITRWENGPSDAKKNSRRRRSTKNSSPNPEPS